MFSWSWSSTRLAPGPPLPNAIYFVAISAFPSLSITFLSTAFALNDLLLRPHAVSFMSVRYHNFSLFSYSLVSSVFHAYISFVSTCFPPVTGAFLLPSLFLAYLG